MKITHHIFVRSSAEHCYQRYSTQAHAANRPDRCSQALPYQLRCIDSYLKLLVRLVKCQNSRERYKVERLVREVGNGAKPGCRGHRAEELVRHRETSSFVWPV
jgi:hypothetical protein